MVLAVVWSYTALATAVMASPTIKGYGQESSLESNTKVMAVYDEDIQSMPTVVGILWYHDKATGARSLQMTDSIHSQVYFASCSNILADGGLFENQPLTLDIDADGLGRVVIGNAAYPIVYEQQKKKSESDALNFMTCTRFSDESVAQLDCLMLHPGQLNGQLSLAAMPNCFPDTVGISISSQFIELRKRGNDSRPLQNPGFPGVSCGYRYPVVRVGNGSPRKKHLCKQMTRQHACTNGGCGVSQGTSISTSFSFTVVGTPADKGWVSAGFGVSKTRTVTTTWRCDGDNQDVVCMWAGQPYVEYEVRRKRQSTGPCEGRVDEWDGPSWRLSSPLGNGDYTYCVRNTCRANSGDSYWEDLNRYPNCAHNDRLAQPNWGF